MFKHIPHPLSPLRLVLYFWSLCHEMTRSGLSSPDWDASLSQGYQPPALKSWVSIYTPAWREGIDNLVSRVSHLTIPWSTSLPPGSGKMRDPRNRVVA